jgi:hypothetical protein
MSAKFSEARKRAFFKALSETGNQTLAAERAKVSRSWVGLHRAKDPTFDAASREALRQAQDRLGTVAKERLGHSPHPAQPTAESPSPAEGRGTNQPPRGWGFHDGAELVVRGSNGRRVQIGRARLHQWSARVEERFLAALAATCNVKAACAEVGMHATSAYAHRKRWSAFARRWDAAIETGYVRIEMALLSNACNLFSADELPPEEPLRGMTVDQAIHILHMHKNEVRGIGRRPGLMARPRGLDEVRDSILRKIEAIQRWTAAQDGEAD